MGTDFKQKYENYQSFYLKIFSFLEVKFSVYLNRRDFVMPGTLLLAHMIIRCWDMEYPDRAARMYRTDVHVGLGLFSKNIP